MYYVTLTAHLGKRFQFLTIFSLFPRLGTLPFGVDLTVMTDGDPLHHL